MLSSAYCGVRYQHRIENRPNLQMARPILREGRMRFEGCFFLNGRRIPIFSKWPKTLSQAQKTACESGNQMVQVGIFVVALVKNAIVEVRLSSEVRNALTWTVVIVRNRKNFFIAGLEFGDGHGSIFS